MSILIKNILHQEKRVDILIDGNKFAKIGSNLDVTADIEIDGSSKAIIPPFYNTHTHAAMSILRGFSDDKPLFDWLQEDIWPIEDKLTSDDIYVASRLAILEMIKSGTVFFSDMYFNWASTIRAVQEMGVRAAISVVELDMFNPELTAAKKIATNDFFSAPNPCPERVIKCISCHAVYTVSDELFSFAQQLAQEQNLYMHIHACETAKEVVDCKEKCGMSPIEKLNSLGLLTNKTILAHAVHLDDNDIAIIKKSGCFLSTNPISNMKLNSGSFMFDRLYQEIPLQITLGTDGAASNNNLSMLESAKFCSMLAKLQADCALSGKAHEVFEVASKNGAVAFGLNAGKIAEGYLADCLLLDLNNVFLTPNYNLISNVIYSADSSCICDVICDGKILMFERKVEGEKEIISQAQALAEKIMTL